MVTSFCEESVETLGAVPPVAICVPRMDGVLVFRLATFEPTNFYTGILPEPPILGRLVHPKDLASLPPHTILSDHGLL